MADRGVTPAVEKLLVVGIVSLFVAGTVTVTLGDVVPELRGESGAELGERVLAQSANHLEGALTAGSGSVDRQVRLDLPASIAGSSYDLVLADRRLRLDHPDSAIAATSPLAVPANASVESGRVDAGSGIAIRVRGPADNRSVTLTEGAT